MATLAALSLAGCNSAANVLADNDGAAPAYPVVDLEVDCQDGPTGASQLVTPGSMVLSVAVGPNHRLQVLPKGDVNIQDSDGRPEATVGHSLVESGDRLQFEVGGMVVQLMQPSEETVWLGLSCEGAPLPSPPGDPPIKLVTPSATTLIQ